MKTGPDAIDSVLLIGFGGPEKPEDVMPFLRNVVRGRNIPDERLREVEKHYLHLGGRSPYNEWTERQRRGVRSWLAGHGSSLPVYVGMRNWHPFLAESLKAMSVVGLQNALGIILAPHQSEASWGRYIQDFLDAVEENGGVAPSLRFLDPFFALPRFLEACAQRLEEATGYRRGAWPAGVPLIFTAHSIPVAMADGSPYVGQVETSCHGVASILGATDWELAYQSRSGSPRTPWLEPDINEALKRRAAAGAKEVAIQAIGFLSDHVEVLYDLDVEAQATCQALGVMLRRAPCVNDHPAFLAMLGERILEASAGAAARS